MVVEWKAKVMVVMPAMEYSMMVMTNVNMEEKALLVKVEWWVGRGGGSYSFEMEEMMMLKVECGIKKVNVIDKENMFSHLLEW